MREILFRGKTPMTDRWVFGTGLLYDGINTWIVNNPIGQAIAFGETKAIVDPETVGQYTGLTDKNGKKIFEGDIVVLYIKGNKTVCKVDFADNVAQFQLWQTNTIPHTPTNLNLGNYDCEVIGNIHDNPELLKGGADNG